MANKCVASKCQTGCTKTVFFHFSLKNEELNEKQIGFVNRSDCVPKKT